MDPFKYQHRWAEILQAPTTEQISMLEARDRELEAFFNMDGRCGLHIPYRWDQIWEALKAGESWAIACAEDNDRVIESLFASCSCGGSTITFMSAPGTSFAQYASFSVPYDLTILSATASASFPEDSKALISVYTKQPGFGYLTSIWGEGQYITTGGHPNRSEIHNLYGTISATDAIWGPYPFGSPGYTDPWPGPEEWTPPYFVANGGKIDVYVEPDSPTTMDWSGQVVITTDGDHPPVTVTLGP